MYKLPIYTFLLLLAPTIGWAQDLQSFYMAALKNTATVKDKLLAEEVARREKQKAYSEVLPTLSLNSTTAWRDGLPSNSNEVHNQHTGYVNLSQPLFQGGSEYYALGIAKRLPKIAQQERLWAEINLYTQVAESFYQVFQLGRELRTLEEQEETLKARVITLQKRAKIGRSKKTDVLSAQTQLARVRADRAALDNDLLLAQLKLKNLTGLTEIGELIDLQNIETVEVPGEWEKNLENNPELLATKLALESADKEIGVANGGFLPDVDVSANYYLERGGSLAESDWDVSLNAKWEILSGGSDYSDRKIKKLEYERLYAKLTDIKRNLYNNYSASKSAFAIKKSTVAKLKSAVDVSKENYRQHVSEANQGLVGQLDTLRALEEYLQVRRAYERQIYDTKIAFVKLRALAGIRP